jgi:hypothetical protein
LNAIIDLDDYGSLVLAAEKSDLTPAAAVSSTTNIAPNDSLVLYFDPDKLDIKQSVLQKRLAKALDRKNESDSSVAELSVAEQLQVRAQVQADAQKRARYLWRRLWEIYHPNNPLCPGTEPPPRIELRTAPLTAAAWEAARAALHPPKKSAAPAVTTTTTDRTYILVNKPVTTRPSPATAPMDASSGTSTRYRDTTSVSTSTTPQPVLNPATQPSGRLPVLRTRSALGVLRAATNEDWGIAVFVTPAQYQFFVHRVLVDSKANNVHLDFYRFRLDDKIDCTDANAEAVNRDRLLAARVPKAKRRPVTATGPSQFLPLDYCRVKRLYDWPEGETRLPNDAAALEKLVPLPNPKTDPTQMVQNEVGETRHFLVIVEQDASDPIPDRTYVSYKYGDKVYYINDEDYVSKKNFVLVGQLLTMEAVPAGGGLTPTISVGGVGH